MRRSTKEQLMSKVTVAPNGCWNYTAHKSNRYPKVNVAGCYIAAHRLSWMEHRGDIPDGLCVLHRCDNTTCVNPDHLFLGTHTDNMRDAARKGRLKPPACPPEKLARGDANGMRRHPSCLAGEKNGRSKLSDEQRREIIRQRAMGVKRTDLAELFGVSESQIGRICRRAASNEAEYGRRMEARD